MSPTTTAAGAATDATAIASTDTTTNTTTNATTNTITNRPTGVSLDNDIEENIPSYNDIGENAPQYDDADRNAGTAPLLPPTYSFAMGPPPPRATWRRMTGGLAAEGNAQGNAEISKHPGVYKVYTRKGWFLIVQWFFTFFVLGATAMSLSRSDKLPSVVPMLAYIVACAAIHVVPMYYFICEINPASPTNPRPAGWYLISYGISSLAWAGAMVCVILVLIESHPFRNDRDREHGKQGCSKGRKCYPSSHNAQINTYACMNTATAGFIILSIIGHWYQISKLWLCTFTVDEVRAAYEFVPGKNQR